MHSFFIQVLPINTFGNVNNHSSCKYSIYFLKSCMSQLLLCYACISFLIQVPPTNIFGNINRHSSCKYNVYFSCPTCHNVHFAMHAYASAMIGKTMLRNAGSTEQYSQQCPTWEVMAFLLKLGHFGSKFLVIALTLAVSTTLYGRQSAAIHFAIVRLIQWYGCVSVP